MTMSPIIKRISVFQVPNGNYLICYDRYAFYIDRKGRRAEKNFKIEWEGNPTAFAYHHPYIIAFEHQFIEIRSIIDVSHTLSFSLSFSFLITMMYRDN
jgi:hypothetical protein